MKLWIGIAVALLFAGAAPAEDIYVFHSHDEETDSLASTVIRHVQPLDAERTHVVVEWFAIADSTSGRLTYVLDGSLATVQWEVQDASEETDYAGNRQGNSLYIQGKHRGEDVEKHHEIDDKPFYANPAIGLQAFALSKEEKTKFWALRPGNLSKHTMKAHKQGIETIEVNGEPLETVRVKWGLSGWKSRFFSRTFWFRTSDGLFVRSSPSRGEWSELVDHR